MSLLWFRWIGISILSTSHCLEQKAQILLSRRHSVLGPRSKYAVSAPQKPNQKHKGNGNGTQEPFLGGGQKLLSPSLAALSVNDQENHLVPFPLPMKGLPWGALPVGKHPTASQLWSCSETWQIVLQENEGSQSWSLKHQLSALLAPF